MAHYVDGFVVPVPKARLDEYRLLAEKAGAVWMEYGALDYRECVAEDVKPGELTSFPKSLMLKEDETVIFAWIVYASREARDRINAQVMADPRLSGMDADDMPFDAKRMFWGGFTTLVALGASGRL